MTRMKPITSVVVVVAAVAQPGCTNQLQPASAAFAQGLPLASLVCPTSVARGAAFTVDGSGSVDDGGFVSTVVTVDGGGVHQESSELEPTFTVDRDVIVTVALVVTDKDDNVARAACRVVVGDVGVRDLVDVAEGEGEADPVVDDGDEERVPGEPADIGGTFALVAYDAPQVNAFGLEPATQCARGKTVSLVTIHQTGTHIALSAKTCSVSLPTVDSWIGRQASALSAGAVRALPSLSVEFELAHAEIGQRFTPVTAPVAQVTGALGLGPGEALPTTASDARLVDADPDGLPGATLRTDNVSDGTFDDHEVVYRRVVHAFSGVIVSNDEIDGSAPGSWQVDGDTALLDDWADMLTPPSIGRPSTFKMTRTSAVRCSDLDLASLPAPPPPADDGCHDAALLPLP